MLNILSIKLLHRAAKRRLRDGWHNRVPTKLLKHRSYEEYRAAQVAGNARKLHKVFATEANIHYLADYARSHLGAGISVLCHGSRNGAEVRWFRQHLADAKSVLGTDIAETATQFPDMIQWDFHEAQAAWLGAWDIIYSNSWDHAFEPERAFANWMKCLAPGGLLLLEHSRSHTPAHVDELDTFGATLPGLCDVLNRVGAPEGLSVLDVIDLPDRSDGRTAVVVGRQNYAKP